MMLLNPGSSISELDSLNEDINHPAFSFANSKDSLDVKSISREIR